MMLSTQALAIYSITVNINIPRKYSVVKKGRKRVEKGERKKERNGGQDERK